MWTKQNYYSHTEHYLEHYFPVEYFRPFLKTTIILLSNYYFGNRRTIGSYTNKKVLLSRDRPCFFPAFLCFNETFFLKLTRIAWHEFSFRNYSTVVFTFWLFGVGYVSLRVWNGCVYNLWNVTQESRSIRVQVLGNHCAQGVFCR